MFLYETDTRDRFIIYFTANPVREKADKNRYGGFSSVFVTFFF